MNHLHIVSTLLSFRSRADFHLSVLEQLRIGHHLLLFSFKNYELQFQSMTSASVVAGLRNAAGTVQKVLSESLPCPIRSRAPAMRQIAIVIQHYFVNFRITCKGTQYFRNYILRFGRATVSKQSDSTSSKTEFHYLMLLLCQIASHCPSSSTMCISSFSLSNRKGGRAV